MIKKFAFAVGVATICANVHPLYGISKSELLDRDDLSGITVKRKTKAQRNAIFKKLKKAHESSKKSKLSIQKRLTTKKRKDLKKRRISSLRERLRARQKPRSLHKNFLFGLQKRIRNSLKSKIKVNIHLGEPLKNVQSFPIKNHELIQNPRVAINVPQQAERKQTLEIQGVLKENSLVDKRPILQEQSEDIVSILSKPKLLPDIAIRTPALTNTKNDIGNYSNKEIKDEENIIFTVQKVFLAASEITNIERDSEAEKINATAKTAPENTSIFDQAIEAAQSTLAQLGSGVDKVKEIFEESHDLIVDNIESITQQNPANISVEFPQEEKLNQESIVQQGLGEAAAERLHEEELMRVIDQEIENNEEIALIHQPEEHILEELPQEPENIIEIEDEVLNEPEPALVAVDELPQEPENIIDIEDEVLNEPEPALAAVNELPQEPENIIDIEDEVLNEPELIVEGIANAPQEEEGRIELIVQHDQQEEIFEIPDENGEIALIHQPEERILEDLPQEAENIIEIEEDVLEDEYPQEEEDLFVELANYDIQNNALNAEAPREEPKVEEIDHKIHETQPVHKNSAIEIPINPDIDIFDLRVDSLEASVKEAKLALSFLRERFENSKFEIYYSPLHDVKELNSQQEALNPLINKAELFETSLMSLGFELETIYGLDISEFAHQEKRIENIIETYNHFIEQLVLMKSKLDLFQMPFAPRLTSLFNKGIKYEPLSPQNY